MHQEQTICVSNTPLMPGVNLMWLKAPLIAGEARPGQYIFARCSPTFDPYMRRPMSIHRIGADGEGDHPEHIAILYGVSGTGTGLLSRVVPGQMVDLVGPLGNGFDIFPESKHILLVGGGVGASPLVGMAFRLLAEGRAVTLVEGARTTSALFPADYLPAALKRDLVTVDGSSGRKGLVTEPVPEHWEWADQVFCCGPFAMYNPLAKMLQGLQPARSVQCLIDTPIACGVGACDACTVETPHGLKQACCDGPRFELFDVAQV